MAYYAQTEKFRKIAQIKARAARDAALEEYRIYRAEQRACGYEVESFEEWYGDVNPRDAAEAQAFEEMRCGA